MTRLEPTDSTDATGIGANGDYIRVYGSDGIEIDNHQSITRPGYDPCTDIFLAEEDGRMSGDWDFYLLMGEAPMLNMDIDASCDAWGILLGNTDMAVIFHQYVRQVARVPQHLRCVLPPDRIFLINNSEMPLIWF